MGTELDILAIGNYLLLKEDQNQDLKENYESAMNWIKNISVVLIVTVISINAQIFY